MALITETSAAIEPRLMNDMNTALDRADTLLGFVTDVQDRLEASPTTQGTPTTESPSPNNLTSKLDALNNTLSLAIEKVRESKALLG